MIKNELNGMLIDGVAASQSIDKENQRINIKNCDISSAINGESHWIWEHAKGPNSTPIQVVGSIRSIKKIFSMEDCDDERQLYWWNLVKQPLIYHVTRLYDGSGHPGAVAVAAIIRDHYANKEKITIRSSIDGSTLERNGGELEYTIFRDLACTLRPCNASCDTGLLYDPVLEAKLGKSENHLASCSVVVNCLPGQGPLLFDPATIQKSEPQLHPGFGQEPAPISLATLFNRAAAQARAKLFA